jgi:hypothetical protein
MEPDVEALLVRRGDAGPGGPERALRHPQRAPARGPGVSTSSPEALLVPVDACYRLVGLVRLHWKGFDGGAEAWAAIDAFFAELREAAVAC